MTSKSDISRPDPALLQDLTPDYSGPAHPVHQAGKLFLKCHKTNQLQKKQY
jgi:hypothetical protein